MEVTAPGMNLMVVTKPQKHAVGPGLKGGMKFMVIPLYVVISSVRGSD
jgi:hypothetical protein